MSELKLFYDSLNSLCRAYQEKLFIPIVEADVTGYLYHQLVIKNKGDASRIHLSARIQSKKGVKKFPDIVVGNVLTRADQVRAYERFVKSNGVNLSMSKEETLRGLHTRDFDAYSRPLIATIELVAEVKALLKGFEYRQLRRRAIEAKDDIETLAKYINAKQRLLVLFDEAGFFIRVNRRDFLGEIVGYRNNLQQNIEIICASVTADGKCSWQSVGHNK